MAVFIRVSVKRTKRITVRAWRKATKAAFQIVAHTWLKEMLPRRFVAGYSAPWIKRRTTKYLKRKQGLIESHAEGIQATSRYQNNVLTGAMRDWLTSTWEVKSYPSRATVTFSKALKPIYVRMNPNKGPDMFREVTKISQAEATKLRKIVRENAMAIMDEQKREVSAKKAEAARWRRVHREVRRQGRRRLAAHRRGVRKSIADQVRAHLRNAA